MEEGFQIFRQLSKLISKRFPDIDRDQLGELLPQARREDPEIAALAERLQELVATHRGSVLRKLWELDEGAEAAG